MAKRRLTKLALLAKLRKTLSRPDTSIKLRKLKVCGHSTWDPESDDQPIRNMKIVLDPRRDGRVRLVIHELLHAHMNLDSSMTYELEEAAILSWEKRLYDYLHHERRTHELELWDRAIRKKLA